MSSDKNLGQRWPLLAVITICLFLSLMFQSLIPLDARAIQERTLPRSADTGPWWSNFTVGSLGSETNTPSVVISNGTLHCVFVNSGVYYSRSLDNGKSWSVPKALSDAGTTGALTPSIFANGSEVYVVWDQEAGSVQTHELYYTKSNDSGISFPKAIMLSGVNGHWSTDQKIIEEGDTVYVVWADDRDDPARANQEVYLKRSDDRGATWGTDQRVTYASWPSWHTWIGALGDTVHIVWEDERLGGTHRIYYKRSSDKGQTWTPDLMISSASIDVIEPSFSMIGQNLYVVWSEEPYAIQYRTSIDGGSSWNAIRTIIGGDSIGRHEPFIKAFGNYIQVLWNQNGDLGYMNSTNGGTTFGPSMLLGTNMELVSNRGGYQELDCDINGSYVVYSHNNTEIRYRYKGLLPDLDISNNDIVFSDPYGHNGTTYVDMNVTIRNLGLRNTRHAIAEVYLDNFDLAGLVYISNLGPIMQGGAFVLSVGLAPKNLSSTVWVVLKDTDPFEMVISNNQVKVDLNITDFFPKVKLTVDKDTTITKQNVQFNVNKSYDPKGIVTKFDLDFGDGNTSDWKDFNKNSTVAHSYGFKGNFTARLKVRDWKSVITEAANLTMIVMGRPPVANITIETPVLERKTSNSISFSADNSYDTDGMIVGYLWNFEKYWNSTDKNFSMIFSNPGQFRISLTVQDNDGLTNKTSLTVNILNRPPLASIFFPKQTQTYHKDETIEFQSWSLDSDGSIVSTFWDFGDGMTRTGINVSHKYRSVGDYPLQLTVTDDLSATNTSRIMIHIINLLPTVSIIANQTTVPSLVPVQFTSTASDQDGAIIKYLWNFNDGTTSNIANPEHTFGAPGNYTVILKVFDDDNASANTTIYIQVKNRDPIAKAWANNTLVYVDDKILFSASESQDLDGRIVSYSWNGAGPDIDSMNFTYHFDGPGIYTIRLTVQDDSGATATTTIRIQVNARPVVQKPNKGPNPLLGYLAVGIGILIVILVIAFVLIIKRKKPSLKGQNHDKAKTDHDDPEKDNGLSKINKKRAQDGPDKGPDDNE